MWLWVTKIFGGIFGKSFIVAAIVGGMALTGWLAKGWINNHLDDYYSTKYEAANYKAQNEMLRNLAEKSDRAREETETKTKIIRETVIEYRDRPTTDEIKDWRNRNLPDGLSDRLRELSRNLSQNTGSEGSQASDGD